MVTDLKQLLHDTVADAPSDHLDLATLVTAGRRRVRGRRTAVGASGAVLVAAVVAIAVVGGPDSADRTTPVTHPPAPDAPTLTLADAVPAVAGQDYRSLASYTNEVLDNGNGQYLDGVTDDGLILFRDGPRADQRGPRFALMDPATDEKDWLPDPTGVGQDQTWPVELGADRLVLLSLEDGIAGGLRAHVYDRADRRWSTLAWPGLPDLDFPRGVVGLDGRLYVRVPTTSGLDVEADAYRLWSVSLTDAADVRDESLTLGQVTFSDTSMVWTEATTTGVGEVHIRDWATGDERVFDPQAGERCEVQSLGATADRVVIGEHCGRYSHGVLDDRVQILTADGAQVTTIQDSEVSGWLPAGSDVVNLTAFSSAEDGRAGTYVYDLATGRFLKVADTISSWGLAGSTGRAGEFLWHTPVNDERGFTQHLGRLTR